MMTTRRVMNRRSLLIGGVGLGAISALAACSSNASPPATPEAPPTIAATKAAVATAPPTPAAQPSAPPTPAVQPSAATTTPVASAAAGGPAGTMISAKGDVHFWHVWGGDRAKLVTAMIDDYKKINPSLTIVPTLLSQTGMQEKYLTAIAGGDPPDVAMIHDRDIVSFADKKALTTVDDYVRKSNFKPEDVWYPGDWKAVEWQGKHQAAPLTPGGGNYLMFWNKTIFEQSGLDPEKGPTSWDDLVQMAEKTTVKKGDAVDRAGYMFSYGGDGLWLEYLATDTGSVFSPDGRKIAFDDEVGTEALNFIVANVDRLYGGWPNIRGFIGEPSAAGNAAFFNGKLALHNAGVFHFYQLQTEAPSLKYGVTVFPYNAKRQGAKALNSTDGGWTYAIPAGSKNPDAAWDWLLYTCAGAGNFTFFQAQGRPSSVAKFNKDPAYTKVNPNWDKVIHTLEDTAPILVTPAWPKIVTALSQRVEEAQLHKEDVATAIHLAAQDAQKLTDDYFKTAGGA